MLARIKDLLDTKVFEIFGELQKELHIESGDIEPMVWLRLEEEEDKLSALIKEILLIQCISNGAEAREHIGDLLTEKEKNRIYYEVREEKVAQDAQVRAKDTGKELTDGEAAIVADRYVNDGDYECGLSYWDNLDNLIDEILEVKAYEEKRLNENKSVTTEEKGE